jgi:hypothetical protein
MPVRLILSYEDICKVCAVDAEECRALQAAEILLCDCEYKGNNADEEENDRIVKSTYVNRHGRNDRTCTENEYDVENIGADNVTECKIAFSLSCGNDGRYKLGREVPTATMVRPMNVWLMPKFSAWSLLRLQHIGFSWIIEIFEKFFKKSKSDGLWTIRFALNTVFI